MQNDNSYSQFFKQLEIDYKASLQNGVAFNTYIKLKNEILRADVQSTSMEALKYLNECHADTKIYTMILQTLNSSKVFDQDLNLSQECKNEALSLIKKLYNNDQIMQTIRVFKLDRSDYLTNFIMLWKDQRDYKNASDLILYLGLQNESYLLEVVFPLIPQHMHFVYNFVKDDPHLISLLIQHINVLYRCEREKFKKIIRTIMKKFKQPANVFPDYLLDIYKGNLYYLTKSLRDGCISYDCWEEMVTIQIKDNSILQHYLFNKLYSQGFKIFAKKISDDYHLYEADYVDCWNSRLLKINHTDFFQLDKSIEAGVHFVDTRSSFERAISSINASADVIGFDSEWRPECVVPNCLALFQIATSDQIYLLDMIALKNLLSVQELSSLLEILSDKNILKLCYGGKADFGKLIKCFPEGTNFKIENNLDIEEFVKYLKEAIPNLMETSEPSYKGLCRLVAETLGKPLDKREQTSDWERRPLRNAQKVYAALDAFCLLKIYAELKVRFTALNLPYDFETLKDNFMKDGFVEKVPEVNPLPDNQPDIQMLQPMDRDPVRITELKFIIDHMFHGTGDRLRILGADVTILKKEKTSEDMQIIEKNEGHIILSSGRSYSEIAKVAPKDKLFYFKQMTLNADQQVDFILKAFNVVIKKEDVYSRCIHCNCINFIHIPVDGIRDMMSGKIFDPAIRTYGNVNIDINARSFENGTVVNVKVLEGKDVEKISIFDICIGCGQIFWKGSHHSSAYKRYKYKLFLRGLTFD